MTRDEFIATLKPEMQLVARAYLPILSRWAIDSGWDTIRQVIYARKSQMWYQSIRTRMTPTERDADDKRAKELVRTMAIRKAELIARERNLLQQIVTLLISALLADL